MKLKIALIGAVAALAAAALIPAGLAAPSKGSVGTIRVRQSELGRILVDVHGRSLYLFEKDRHGKSSCDGACAAAWPPLIAPGKPRAGAGVKASLLGRTKRKDGRWQVTYNRHPLYTFVKDTKRGQTNGEGVDAFGAEWYLVSPAGAKVENEAMSSSGDDPAPGGYGGYGDDPAPGGYRGYGGY
jgi:predicted lipoprotein with Yx(FWY)xxD motif